MGCKAEGDIQRLVRQRVLGLPERPAGRKDKTTQPSAEPSAEPSTQSRAECETELIRKKCSICETKILFGVLCFKFSQIIGLCFFGSITLQLKGSVPF